MLPSEALEAFERVLRAIGVAGQLVNSTGSLDSRLDQWVRRRLHGSPTGKRTIHPRLNLTTSFVAPSTATEIRVAELWEKVFGTRVGVHDSFREMGGNSLFAIQLLAGLRHAFQLNLPLSLVFETPTVAQMAASVDLAQAEMRDEGLPMLPSKASNSGGA